MDDQWLLIGGIVAVFVVLWLAIWFATSFIAGAGLILGFAATQGFVGIAAYVLLWVLATPFMVVASLLVGFVASILVWLGERNASSVPTHPPPPTEDDRAPEVIDVDDADDLDEIPQRPQRRPDEMLAIDPGALRGL